MNAYVKSCIAKVQQLKGYTIKPLSGYEIDVYVHSGTHYIRIQEYVRGLLCGSSLTDAQLRDVQLYLPQTITVFLFDVDEEKFTPLATDKETLQRDFAFIAQGQAYHVAVSVLGCLEKQLGEELTTPMCHTDFDEAAAELFYKTELTSACSFEHRIIQKVHDVVRADCSQIYGVKRSLIYLTCTLRQGVELCKSVDNQSKFHVPIYSLALWLHTLEIVHFRKEMAVLREKRHEERVMQLLLDEDQSTSKAEKKAKKVSERKRKQRQVKQSLKARAVEEQRRRHLIQLNLACITKLYKDEYQIGGLGFDVVWPDAVDAKTIYNHIYCPKRRQWIKRAVDDYWLSYK